VRDGEKLIKDISLLGRDINKVIIVDNSPQCYEYQPENAVSVSSWFGDTTDCELRELTRILLSETMRECDDVREGLIRASQEEARKLQQQF
jgi:TFIIF-interacting CTD phosphatase-like protein